MSDKVKYWFTGQAGYELDCGAHKKIRVVFAMISEDKSQIAWYIFASMPGKKDQKAWSGRDADKVVKTGQAECAKTSGAPDQFGYRSGSVGRLIPHTFEKKIGIDGLADGKGTFATLSIEPSETGRLLGYRISDLKTKAGETVSFPFGTQVKREPSPTNTTINGRVHLLETGGFVEKDFPKGPQEKSSIEKINGGVL